MQVQPAPAQVADAVSALGCFYNGEQPAIVRAGVVRFPAFALFTIEQPGTPAHGATFSVQSDNLNPITLATRYHETIYRFAN